MVLIDGATELGNMAALNFPGCIQIVGFHHALEHAGLVLEALIGKTRPDYRSRLHVWDKRLPADKIETLIADARQACAVQPPAPAVEKALHYLVRNVSRDAIRHLLRGALPQPVRAWWKRAAKP